MPDDLVQGRVFRAKCDDCSHTFEVAALATGADASVAASARNVKIALSDDDVSKLVDAASPAPPQADGARAAERAGVPARAGRPPAAARRVEPPLPAPQERAAPSDTRPIPEHVPPLQRPEPPAPAPPQPVARSDTRPISEQQPSPARRLEPPAPAPLQPAGRSDTRPIPEQPPPAALRAEPPLPEPSATGGAALDTPLPWFSFASDGTLEPPLPALPKLDFTSDGALEPPLPKFSLDVAGEEPPLPKLSFGDLPDLSFPAKPRASITPAATPPPPAPAAMGAVAAAKAPAAPPPAATQNEPVELEELLEPAPQAPLEPPAAPVPTAREAAAPQDASASGGAAAPEKAAAPEEATAPEAPPELASAPRRKTPASRARPARKAEEAAADDIGGNTDEFAIAAGTKHRHRSAALALAGGVVVCAAAGVLLMRVARRPADVPRGPRAAASAAAPSGSAPFDPSSLAARPRTASAPSAKPAAGTRPRRRIVAGRIDDRKLLDLLGKKEDVAMAAPAGDVELDSANDVLDPAAVERTVGASRKAFDACITKVLRLNPGFRVPGKRATIIVTVQPTGKVTGAWIGEEQVEGTDLGRCLVAAASRMSFPTFEGDAIDVSIPLSLSAIQ